MKRVTHTNGFSLPELLCVLTIIGVLLFMAIPSANTAKTNSEDQTMIHSVTVLDLAMTQLYNTGGSNPIVNSTTSMTWSNAVQNGDTADIYSALSSFLAYPPPTLTGAHGYLFGGYSVTFPSSIDLKTQIILQRNGTTIVDSTGALYP